MTTTDLVHSAIGIGTTATAWEAARARTAREKANFMITEYARGRSEGEWI